MSRRWAFAIAALLFVGAAVLWRVHLKPRTITVCLFADPAFRQRANWETILNSRIQAVNRIYESQAGIHWRVTASRPDPTINDTDLDSRRATLARNTDCRADLVLGITGARQGDRAGSVSPFSHAAFVIDDPQQSEERNTLVLAHELAHLFGAVHDPSSGTLMTEPPASATFPPRTATLIRSLRNYDFSQGTHSLEGRWGPRVTVALARMLTGVADDPARQAQQIVAAALTSDGEYAAAVPHLETAVEADPQNVQARFDLAVTLERNAQPDAALKTLREGARLNPKSARLHSALGAALLKHNREEAIDEFMTSLHLEPNNGPLYSLLGQILSSGIGRTDAAIAAYRSALKLDPNLPQAQQGLAQALAAKAQAEEDVALTRRAAHQHPVSPEASYNLGVAESRAGDIDAAADAFRRSIRLEPGFGLAHSSLAMMEYLRGDYAAASEEVQAAKAAGVESDAAFVESLSRKLPR